MDRIQDALARARAARRDGAAPAAAPSAAPAAVPSGRPASGGLAGAMRALTGRDAAQPRRARPVADWSALPTFRPDTAIFDANRVVAHEGSSDSAPFDVLRTKLLKQMRDNGWTRLAITSPTPSCGKSTVALNLALSLSRQAETRAMLFEMDFRKPSLSRLTGMRRRLSFSRVLKGREPFEEHAVRVGENLLLALNANPIRNPAELMHAPSVPEALRDIEKRYRPDIVVCDMPPILIADDTLAFAPQVDCVLLVAAADKTSVAEVDRCERDLSERTNVLGVILNKCHHTGAEYGYGYGYEYEHAEAPA